MKTAILTAAMMILMTAAVSARTINDTVANPLPAEKELKVTISQPGAHMVNFRIANPKADKVVMKIYDEKNIKVLHRTTKTARDYSLKCDLTNCDPGIYTAVIEHNGQEEARKQILILK
jgi:hypothetical protein